MTDLTHLDQLLSLLRRHGVEQYKDDVHGLALVLAPAPFGAIAEPQASTTATLPASSTDSLPADDDKDDKDDEPTWEDPV